MPHTVIMSDVPPDKVDEVMHDATLEGATVTKTQQADGNFTVTAIFPDTPMAAAKVADGLSRHGEPHTTLMAFSSRGKRRRARG